MSAQQQDRAPLPYILLSIERVMEATDFGKSKIAEMNDPESPRYDPTFPKPRRVGARSKRWRSDELVNWMDSLPVLGDTSKAGESSNSDDASN